MAHASVNVHPVPFVNGPDSWKLPMWKLKLEPAAQQTWNALLATPAVAVPKLNSRCGEDDTATSKEPSVYPDGVVAATEHGVDASATRARFEFANPVPVNCTTHGAVSAHSESCVSGPFNVKTPTSKEKSTFAAGSCDKHKRYSSPAVPPVISVLPVMS
jgi:hypothetical protein